MTAALLRFTIYDLRFTIFKLLLTFFLFSLLSLLFTTSAFAQTNASPAAATTYNLQPTTYTAGPHLASQAIYNFSHAMSCILIGQSPIAPCLEYRMYKDAQGMVKSVPYLSSTNTSNGVLGMSLSMIGEVIGNPPVHSSLFIANLGEQIGIKSANAQVSGSGSGVLAPIFKLWEVSRNISYLAMIIIFIGVGFMVMFRQKLNPQTVVSVQLALPGLVIGLVMITFSYFLAALISDMAFVGTNLVGYYFSLAQTPVPPATSVTPTQLPLMTTTRWWTGGVIAVGEAMREANVLTIFSRLTSVLPSDYIHGALSDIWVYLDDPNQEIFPKDLWKLAIPPTVPDFFRSNKDYSPRLDAAEALLDVSRFIIFQLLSPLNTLAGGTGTAANAIISLTIGSMTPAGVSSIALGFVASIILIYSMFKLLLRLIQNLLSIIFLTIAAPFYFLATSLPGKQGLLPNWFFNMLCNVLAFPAVFAIFYFVAFILRSGNPDPLFQVGAGASITGETTFPLLGGLTSDFLNRLLAFGALVALPSIPDIICRAVGKPSQLGALAAGALGGAIAAGQRYQGQVGGGISNLTQNMGNLRDQPFRYSEIDPANPKRVIWRESKVPRPGEGTPTPGTISRITTSRPWRAIFGKP